MVAIVGTNKRYHVCGGGAHGFYDTGELIRNIGQTFF
jgi:hypothetical protein